MSVEELARGLTANLPTTLVLAAFMWKATPYLVKKTLLNGGGQIIQGHIEVANAAQSLETAKSIRVELDKHEARDRSQYGTLGEQLAVVRERMAALAATVEAHLAARVP